MKLIDKDALVAEIEKKGYYAQTMSDNAINGSMRQFYDGMKQGCVNILSFLNTLEVKVTDEVKIGETQIYLEDDGGEPPYDGKQWLDLSCTEYEIPKDFKNGDNVEILIRKVQKGG